jgi:hypothetical protein
MIKQTFAAVIVAACIVGCSTDENPITPQKMSEIRKQEADQRAHFNPNMTPPPSSPGSTK